jgi:hypothetical protein
MAAFLTAAFLVRRRASVSHTLAADDVERLLLYLARDQVASNQRLVGRGLAVPTMC